MVWLLSFPLHMLRKIKLLPHRRETLQESYWWKDKFVQDFMLHLFQTFLLDLLISGRNYFSQHIKVASTIFSHQVHWVEFVDLSFVSLHLVSLFLPVYLHLSFNSLCTSCEHVLCIYTKTSHLRNIMYRAASQCFHAAPGIATQVGEPSHSFVACRLNVMRIELEAL